MTNQGIGLDAVALLVVAPAALLAAGMVRRDHLAGPPLALLPAVFAVYTAPQYVIGPEYQQMPGNNEQFFLLHLGLLLVGIAVLLLAWQACFELSLREEVVLGASCTAMRSTRSQTAPWSPPPRSARRSARSCAGSA